MAHRIKMKYTDAKKNTFQFRASLGVSLAFRSNISNSMSHSYMSGFRLAHCFTLQGLLFATAAVITTIIPFNSSKDSNVLKCAL